MIDLSNLSISHIIELASPSCAIAVFGYHWRSAARAGKDADLKSLMAKALKAGSLPTAIILVLCGFDTQLLSYLKGAGVYLTIAGLATSFVCIKAIRE